MKEAPSFSNPSNQSNRSNLLISVLAPKRGVRYIIKYFFYTPEYTIIMNEIGDIIDTATVALLRGVCIGWYH